MRIHFFDKNGKFYIRPFVYSYKTKRDPTTLRLIPSIDENKRLPVRFFVNGAKYKLWAIFPLNIHLFDVQKGAVHLFGTDELGRDVFSRCLYATRSSLSVGLIGVIFTFVLGLIMGGIAGFIGGTIDNIIMRLIEFIRSLPEIPLWLGLSASLPRDWSALKVYFAITIILSLISWTNLARRVRSKLLALREEDFIISAKLAGCSRGRIISRHLLPSFSSYIIVDITISFPWMILGETSLSFLGLGLREPAVSYGVLLYSAQNILALAHMPWLLIPGIFVVIAVIAFNFIGDGLRDAADPYSRM
jgi:peptide/nickel transport system permease protein